MHRGDETQDEQAPRITATACGPAGCVIIEHGEWVIIRASCRSIGLGVNAVVAAVLLNTVFAIIGLSILGATFESIAGSPPFRYWLRFVPDCVLPTEPVGIVCSWLIFALFAYAGLRLTAQGLVVLGGRTEVHLRGQDGAIFTGVGPIGIRRSFDRSMVTGLSIHTQRFSRGPDAKSIAIDAGRTLRFGYLLSVDRRAWMYGELRRRLRPFKR